MGSAKRAVGGQPLAGFMLGHGEEIEKVNTFDFTLQGNLGTQD